MKKYVFVLIVFFILISSFSLVSAALPLSVELAVPGYTADESLKHPQKFFSGQPLKLVADFSGLDLSSIEAELRGTQSGVQAALEIQRVDPEGIGVAIPAEIPTDSYGITLTVDGVEYATGVEIHGLDTGAGGRGGGGAVAESLSAAVLYTSMIDCGNCYWESVLTGHPMETNHLIIAGIADRDEQVQVSHDGGKTWVAGMLQTDLPFRRLADPVVRATQDGSYLLSGIARVPDPLAPDGPEVLVGMLFHGSVSAPSFAGKAFKDVTDNYEPGVGQIFIDYPKLAYDQNTGTTYISGNFVKFSDAGGQGKGLFVSQDGGNTFTERRLGRVEITKEIVRPDGTRLRSTIIGGPIWSMDTTPAGELRALVKFPPFDGEIDPDRRDHFGLLRFDETAEHFTVVEVESAWLFSAARISAESTRAWHVYEGPEIAIDKSDRHPGRIYVVWAEPQSIVLDPEFQFGEYGEDFDVYLIWSDNDGSTWSEPLRVNDDDTTTDQVFPSIDVDSSGMAHLAFLDKRKTQDSHYYDVYYVKIVDGEVSRNVRVNPDGIGNSLGGREPGDYMDMLEAYPSIAYVSYPCANPNDFYERPFGVCFSAVDPNFVAMPGEFIRGDSNDDSVVDMSDAIQTLSWLFSGAEAPRCMDGADANDDGVVDMSDAISTLGFLFQGNPKQLLQPFPDFGLDPTSDNLQC